MYLPNGRGMTLGIWDTAGAERFESLSRVYYHSVRTSASLSPLGAVIYTVWGDASVRQGAASQREGKCRSIAPQLAPNGGTQNSRLTVGWLCKACGLACWGAYGLFFTTTLPPDVCETAAFACARGFASMVTLG